MTDKTDGRRGQTLRRSLNVRLSDAQHEGLSMIAAQRGEGVSETIRDAVERFLRGFVDEGGNDLLSVLEHDLAVEQLSIENFARSERRRRARGA